MRLAECKTQLRCLRHLAILTLLAMAICGSASICSASIANVYLAQTPIGGGNGADCADALAVSWFNNSANWGSGSSQIGPGTTVHLCGTITAATDSSPIVVQGSGTSTNPIIVLFESNAILQSPAFHGNDLGGGCSGSGSCGGAIDVFGFNDIIIDGGTNGIIQNTANGTSLANSLPSQGVYLRGSNIIVRNLTIKNIYQNLGSNPAATDSGGYSTADIMVDGSSTNVTICNNTLNNAKVGIDSGTNGGTGTSVSPICSSNIVIPGIFYFNNTVDDHCWQMKIVGNGSPNIYNNDFGTNVNWQYPSSSYHTDGLIIFGAPANNIITPYIYNNYFHGDLGSGSPTADVYCTYGDTGSGSSCYIFNNLFVGTGITAHNDTAIWVGASIPGTNPIGPIYICNNTIVGFNVAILPYGNVNGGVTVYNNIASMDSNAYFMQDLTKNLTSVLTASDHNVWHGGRGSPFSGPYYTFAQLQATGFDVNSSPGDPNLDSSYKIHAGSVAIGIGANLTNVKIAGLNAGKPSVVGVNGTNDGVPRSPTAPSWDAGSYPDQPATPPPTPPTGLIGTVK